jgi:phospholipid/cholesterol/gamma-HCH transport system substrate-binding protein
MTPAGGIRVARRSALPRAAALAALALCVVAVIYLLLNGGGDSHTYRLEFENGGQLVEGNEVLIGGQPVGSVQSVELTDDAQAEITVEMEQPLHEGAQAVIRATSLSGIANRYVSITDGPDSREQYELEEGGVITQVDTTSPVELDQLFNTFNAKGRRGLRDIIRGYGDAYAGRGAQANLAYKYLNPSLVATDRLFAELSSDQVVLERFLVDGAGVMTALADRRDDLSNLVSNTNQGLGAIARENVALDRSLQAFPPAMRQANTTFVNLRATFDDLDPFVAAAKPATKNLAPFLRRLKGTAKGSIPVFHDLRFALRRSGKHNDLTEFLRQQPRVRQRASVAFPEAIRAERCSATDPSDCGSPPGSDPPLQFLRPYTPDLFNALGKLGAVTAYYDANGHFARIQSVIPAFEHNPVTGDLVPFGPPFPTTNFSDFQFPASPENQFRRCPGGATQVAPDSSNPFLDLGDLSSGLPPADCNATQVLPGP